MSIGDPTLPDAGMGMCCLGAAVYGPSRCTCWVAEYDIEQQPPAPSEVVARSTMCGDCAFRGDSPERAGDVRFACSEPGALEELVLDERLVFTCHVGTRRAVALVHPSGARHELPPCAYEPPIVDGKPYKADGTPADLCAGLLLMREAKRDALDIAQASGNVAPDGG